MDAVPQSQTSSTQSSPRLRAVDGKHDAMERDSAYSSASESAGGLPLVSLTPVHLAHLNKQLETMHPKDILRLAKILFPNLYQSTAFGLTGLATLDMLSKLEEESPGSSPVHIIFLDTLYHFKETYDLVDRVKARYPDLRLHTFKPEGFETVVDFEETYGKLYELSEEMYDWVAKVEPQQRAYDSLNVAAVLTGRRRSQGGQRDKIAVVEIDEERGIVKINPLVTWSFAQVQAYVRENNVPYNELLDRGYKSIGDWHSTSPVAEGEDERAGRWKGRQKTECGIHNKQSRYAQFLEESAAKGDESGAESRPDSVETPSEAEPAEEAPAVEATAAVEAAPSAPVESPSLVESISAQVLDQVHESRSQAEAPKPDDASSSPAPARDELSSTTFVPLVYC